MKNKDKNLSCLVSYLFYHSYTFLIKTSFFSVKPSPMMIRLYQPSSQIFSAAIWFLMWLCFKLFTLLYQMIIFYFIAYWAAVVLFFFFIFIKNHFDYWIFFVTHRLILIIIDGPVSMCMKVCGNKISEVIGNLHKRW